MDGSPLPVEGFAQNFIILYLHKSPTNDVTLFLIGR